MGRHDRSRPPRFPSPAVLPPDQTARWVRDRREEESRGWAILATGISAALSLTASAMAVMAFVSAYHETYYDVIFWAVLGLLAASVSAPLSFAAAFSAWWYRERIPSPLAAFGYLPLLVQPVMIAFVVVAWR